jgi:O-antigen ligase
MISELLSALGLLLSLVAWWGYGYAALLLITSGAGAVVMLSGQRALLQTTRRLRMFWPSGAAFGASLVLSAIFSVDLARSVIAISWSAATALIAIICASAIQINDRAAVLRAMMIVSMILVIANIGAWLVFYGGKIPSRVFWENNNGIAEFNILFLAGLAVGIFRARVSWLWLAAYGWLTWFSASRGGALGLMIGMSVLMARFRGLRLPFIVTGLTTVAIIATAAERGLFNGSSRLDYWLIAWRMFVASPIVGQGPDTYQQFYTPGHVYLFGHAHSLPLNLLAENGIIGLLTFAWLAAIIAWQLWQRRQDAFALGTLAAFASLMAHSLVDVPSTSPFIAGTMAILLGLSLVRGGETHAAQKEGSSSQDSIPSQGIAPARPS